MKDFYFYNNKVCFSFNRQEMNDIKKPYSSSDENVSIGREKFSSGIGVFFATLGSAVGLGNIWKFPTLVGENGGGAFILIYLLCILLLGIPVMVSEFYIGRKTRKNTVGAFKKLNVNPAWKIIGYLGILSSLFIIFFYGAVAGWVFSYVFKSLRGDFSSIASLPMDQATELVSSIFETTVSSPIAPIIWHGIALTVVGFILLAGVKKGIERITKTLMPMLFVLIVIIGVRSLTLEGAGMGLQFLFTADFSKITPKVILAALGLSFFKLSIGMGTMTTYGSYFTEDNNMINNSYKVAISDTLVSLLVGIAIFPVVFTFGLKPDSGAGLLFSTIPLVFSRIPFGNVLLTAFFLLTSFAAIMAMLSIVEVPVAFMIEELKLKRKTAVILLMLFIFIVGALTVHPASLFGNVDIYGRNFFDLFDQLSSQYTMPIGGLLISIFIGYIQKKESIFKELSNGETLNNRGSINIYYNTVKVVTPILLILVFLNSIGII